MKNSKGGGGFNRLRAPYNSSFGLSSFAFTLAEVLITLSIIGIVAAMTLPAIIQKQQEKIIVNKLKKNYSIMQQAYFMALNDKGTPDKWNLIENLNTNNNEVKDENNFLYHMKEYLKIIKYCGSEKKDCWTDAKALNGNGFNDHEYFRRYSKAILADGSNILTFVESSDCTITRSNIKDVCGFYRTDINGNKPPNTLGKDIFTFYITKTRLIPAGTEKEANGAHSFEKNCRDSKAHQGRGCTAWVIYNENMDYLHCSDLSWNGKKTCK